MFFFLTASPPSFISSLSLHDALPIFLHFFHDRFPRIPLDHFQPALDSGAIGRPGSLEAMGRKLFSVSRDFGNLAEVARSEEHTSELQSLRHLVCRLLLEKKKEYYHRD